MSGFLFRGAFTFGVLSSKINLYKDTVMIINKPFYTRTHNFNIKRVQFYQHQNTSNDVFQKLHHSGIFLTDTTITLVIIISALCNIISSPSFVTFCTVCCGLNTTHNIIRFQFSIWSTSSCCYDIYVNLCRELLNTNMTF